MPHRKDFRSTGEGNSGPPVSGKGKLGYSDKPPHYKKTQKTNMLNKIYIHLIIISNYVEHK